MYVYIDILTRMSSENQMPGARDTPRANTSSFFLHHTAKYLPGPREVPATSSFSLIVCIQFHTVRVQPADLLEQSAPSMRSLARRLELEAPDGSVLGVSVPCLLSISNAIAPHSDTPPPIFLLMGIDLYADASLTANKLKR